MLLYGNFSISTKIHSYHLFAEIPMKVDKRITLENLKKKIEPEVGCPSDMFRVCIFLLM